LGDGLRKVVGADAQGPADLLGGLPVQHLVQDGRGLMETGVRGSKTGSLRRLKTDYVDLYSLHLDDPETPLEETVEAMDAIVRSGKARYIGVSNLLAYRLFRALGIQPRYNLLFREVERELFLSRWSGKSRSPSRRTTRSPVVS
jgi:aryl-alcohol dehydrogenase-like predicted oxidoreductase